jgi:short-subunit dehydrogenase
VSPAQTVFITGASSGIGESLARHYAARGARLGLVARRGEILESLARSLPGEHRCYALDVSDAAALQDAAEDFVAAAGVPDIVIANAGISVGTLAGEADDLAALRRVLEVNVLGIAHTLQPFVTPMRQRGSGRLVGIASVAGIRGLPGAGAYSASKAAAIALLESMRVELRGSGVRVVTIAPGYIETPMTAVNTYPMPFILPVDAAVARMVKAIDRGSSYAVVPWQMAVVAKLLRLLPDTVFDFLFAHAGRKPRGLDL